MLKVAIISPFKLPIPATQGGGVENLIQLIIDENEEHEELCISLFGKFDKSLKNIQSRYKHTKFYFINADTAFDSVYYWFVKILKRLKLVKLNRYLFIARSILKDLKQDKYDKVLVVNNLDLLNVLCPRIDSDVMLYLHNDIFFKGKESYYSAIKKCSKILTVSEFIRNQVLTYEQVSPDRVEVLRNGINTQNFQKVDSKQIDQLKAKYGIQKNEIIILYSGRVVYEKGVKELLLAFKSIVGKFPIKLLIVGGTWYNQNHNNDFVTELSNLSFEFKEKIVFTGYIDYSKIHLIYQLSDIVAVPTMYVEEAASLVVIESMASGKPLIVTDSGGMPEYASPECAILVKRDKDVVDNLAKAIEQLVVDRELRNSMGEAGLIASYQCGKECYYKNFVARLKSCRAAL